MCRLFLRSSACANERRVKSIESRFDIFNSEAFGDWLQSLMCKLEWEFSTNTLSTFEAGDKQYLIILFV